MYLFQLKQISEDLQVIEVLEPPFDVAPRDLFYGTQYLPLMIGQRQLDAQVNKDRIVELRASEESDPHYIAIVYTKSGNKKKAAQEVLKHYNAGGHEERDKIAALANHGEHKGDTKTISTTNNEYTYVEREVCPVDSDEVFGDINVNDATQTSTMVATVDDKEFYYLYPDAGGISALVLSAKGNLIDLIDDKEHVISIFSRAPSVRVMKLPKVNIRLESPLCTEVRVASDRELDVSQFDVDLIESIDVAEVFPSGICLVNHDGAITKAVERTSVPDEILIAMATSTRGGVYRRNTDPIASGKVKEVGVVQLDSFYDMEKSNRSISGQVEVFEGMKTATVPSAPSGGSASGDGASSSDSSASDSSASDSSARGASGDGAVISNEDFDNNGDFDGDATSARVPVEGNASSSGGGEEAPLPRASRPPIVKGSPVFSLQGKKFCATGRFERLGTRDEIEEMLDPFGATMHSSVVNDLDYLVVGTLSSKTGKMKEAQRQNNTTIIGEVEFERLLEGMKAFQDAQKG